MWAGYEGPNLQSIYKAQSLENVYVFECDWNTKDTNLNYNRRKSEQWNFFGHRLVVSVAHYNKKCLQKVIIISGSANQKA